MGRFAFVMSVSNLLSIAVHGSLNIYTVLSHSVLYTLAGLTWYFKTSQSKQVACLLPVACFFDVQTCTGVFKPHDLSLPLLKLSFV